MTEHSCYKERDITALQIREAQIMEKLDNITENQKNLEDKFDKFINSADVRYAIKSEVDMKLRYHEEKITRFERIIARITWVIVSSVLWALLILIWKWIIVLPSLGWS